MNSKIISIKKTSSIFLATVLIAGTIAAFSPSFMTTANAQVESYYGMDNNNYKSQYGQDNYKSQDSSSVFVKKINCNNVNVNVNGLELDGLPPALANLLSSGDKGERGAASYGSGGQSDYGNNNFKFICINNNNNVVVGNDEEPIPPTPTPIPTECTDCFLSTNEGEPIPPDRLAMLNNFLASHSVSVGATAEVWGNVQGYCGGIEEQNTAGTPASEFQIRSILAAAFVTTEQDPIIEEIIDCLISLGLITPTS